MNKRAWLMGCAALAFLSCGYVGPVMPPSPRIPTTITDVAVTEQGENIIVTFTTPARTVDGVAITEFTEVELRVNNKLYDLELPSPSDKDDPQPKPMVYPLKASEWAGQTLAVSARTSVRKTDHFSAWSNPVSFAATEPLQTPVVKAASSSEGIVLTWDAMPGVDYQVQRLGSGDKQPMDLATVQSGRYVDVSSAFDTEYRYSVIAIRGGSRSQPSNPVVYTALDTFAPAVPSGLTAAAVGSGINLSWQRDVETDLAGYYVERSIDGGAFARLGGLVNLPVYNDSDVQHGKTYSYRIAATDKKNNVSAPCTPVQIFY